MRRIFFVCALVALSLLPATVSAHFYVQPVELGDAEIGITLEKLLDGKEDGVWSEEVYLYNVGRDLFLNAGDHFGVRTVLYNVGIPIRIMKTTCTVAEPIAGSDETQDVKYTVYHIKGPFGYDSDGKENILRGSNVLKNENDKDPNSGFSLKRTIEHRRAYFTMVTGGTRALGENWSIEPVEGMNNCYTIEMRRKYNPVTGDPKWTQANYDLMLVAGQPTAMPFLKNYSNTEFAQNKYRNVVTLKTKKEEDDDIALGRLEPGQIRTENQSYVGDGKLENRYWKIVTREQLKADFKIDRDRKFPPNISFKIAAANFNRANTYNDAVGDGVPGWHNTGTFDYTCMFKPLWPAYTDEARFNQFDCASISYAKEENTNAATGERGHGKKGDMVYQDFEITHAGLYRLECQGLYYNDSKEGQDIPCIAEMFVEIDGDDDNAKVNRAVDLLPRTHGDAAYAALEKYVKDENNIFSKIDGKITNKVEGAIALAYHYFPCELPFYVSLKNRESAKVRIGVRLKKDLVEGDYAYFDDFQLKYLNEPFVLDENDENITDTRWGDENIKYDNKTLLFKRTMDVGKWNAICMPVSLTKYQLQKAFGATTRLAQLSGLEGKTIHFTSIDFNKYGDKETVLKENYCYIIKPYLDVSKVPVKKLDKYNVEVEITDYYLFEGVTLKKADIINEVFPDPERIVDPQGSFSNSTGCKIQMFGTYQMASAPAKAYAFSNGKLYHITTDMPIKGFRCWIEDKHQMGTSSSAPRHPLGTYIGGVSDETTAIDWVYGEYGDEKTGDGKIYNVNGQVVGTDKTALSTLPKGIYVVNGKKFVVK